MVLKISEYNFKLDYYLIHNYLLCYTNIMNRKKEIVFRKESDKYINNFAIQTTIFLHCSTDIFIKYDGENYQFINEDDFG